MSRTAIRSRPASSSPTAPRTRSEILLTLGREEVQRYIIDEVQKVYRSQGVNTNDKHIEVICRQMLRKVSIDYPGDTDFLQDERIDRFEFNQINEEILAQGGEPATAMPVLLGITKASLETDSLPLGGVVPGDHAGADRGRDQRQGRPAARAEGKRHHRQADPGGFGLRCALRRPGGADALDEATCGSRGCKPGQRCATLEAEPASEGSARADGCRVDPGRWGIRQRTPGTDRGPRKTYGAE